MGWPSEAVSSHVVKALQSLPVSVVRILKFDDPIRKISVVSESDPDPKSMLKT